MTARKQLSLDLTAPPAGNDEAPPLNFRRSARARHLQIKVGPHKGIEVIVPRNRGPDEVAHFLEANREWIRNTWQKLKRDYPEAGQLVLPQLIRLPSLGREWQVAFADVKRLVERGDRLLLPQAGTPLQAALRLQAWVKQKAAAALPPRVEAWAARTGLEPGRISIRGQATRWGSCSSRGTLSLNFRLMFLEAPEIDCLVLHELCHLQHMNHGRSFWALMERHMPGARARDRRLGEGWKLVPAWALVK